MSDVAEKSEDADQAIDHLQTYFERKGDDRLAEHLLEDLEVVREKLEDCGDEDS